MSGVCGKIHSWRQELLFLLVIQKLPVKPMVGIQTKEGKFDGYSECWNAGKFRPKNLNDLMELVRKSETCSGHNLELRTESK